MSRVLIGILVLLAVLSWPASSLPGEVSWQVVRTSHFLVYHAARSEETGRSMGEAAEKWYDLLTARLGFEPRGVIPVYLYPDRVSFARAAGVRRDDSIVGLAQARVIRVDASGAFADVERVLAHEMVHVFIARRLYGNTPRIPLWMHEGMAQFFSGDWDQNSLSLLQDAVPDGALFPLKEIESRFPADQRGRAIAYAQSYSIVEYIARQFSPESLQDLIGEVRRGRRFDIAVLYSLGREMDEVEREWRESLWHKYGTQRWFKLGTAVVSAFMVTFAVLAFLSRLRQKRRKALEFERAADRGFEYVPTDEEMQSPRRSPALPLEPRRRRSVPRSRWPSRRARTSDEPDSRD